MNPKVRAHFSKRDEPNGKRDGCRISIEIKRGTTCDVDIMVAAGGINLHV
jgi:hypothetical protein